jgi:hypothetical protein
MRFSRKSSVFVFGLLLGGFFSPVARARADDSTADHASVPVTDANLPDDPAVAIQEQRASLDPGGSGVAGSSLSDAAIQGRQTKRILYVVPNFRSVSADQQLRPQSVKEKFKASLQDSFDYSSFIFVGGQAGVAQATNSYPEFGQGAKGYGRYYWHTLADAINENTWVEFIVPSALHQDTRFYTLGHGEFGKRVAYAASRVLITRTDAGNRAFNVSEVLGAGAFSGTANLYYPRSERTLTKTYQRWITNLCIDGGVFVFKEVWPDINNAVFHQAD